MATRRFAKVTLTAVPTDRFVMSPIELRDQIDFEVKRVYFITDPVAATSTHCHYEEKEFFVLVKGTCTALIDAGQGIEEIPMQGPTSALYVPNYVWHGFKDFSPDAVLLALSSTNYDPTRADYLEDYDAYLKIRDEKLAIA
jgi:mannose-6-phosphate isomerase-like protein (cupin superfamily)